MPDVNLNNKILPYEKLKQISEDDPKKNLEPEKEEKEEVEVKKGYTITDDPEGSMGVLEYAAMQAKIQSGELELCEDIPGIKFYIDKSQPNNKFDVKIDGNVVTINASKCVIDIAEVTNPELEIVLAGQNVQLNSNFKVKSITSTAINAIINGSDEDDNIIAKGLNTTVNAGKGNDRIKATGLNAIIRGGAGDDDINVKGSGSQVYGGEGNDNIHAAGVDMQVDAGGDTNTLRASGSNIVIDPSGGENDITAVGQDIVIDSAKGANNISARGDVDVQNIKDTDSVINNDIEFNVKDPEPTHPDGIDSETGKLWKDGKIANGIIDGALYADGFGLYSADGIENIGFDAQNRLATFQAGGITYAVQYNPDKTFQLNGTVETGKYNCTIKYNDKGLRTDDISRTVYDNGDVGEVSETIVYDENKYPVEENFVGKVNGSQEYSVTNKNASDFPDVITLGNSSAIICMNAALEDAYADAVWNSARTELTMNGTTYPVNADGTVKDENGKLLFLVVQDGNSAEIAENGIVTLTRLNPDEDIKSEITSYSANGIRTIKTIEYNDGEKDVITYDNLGNTSLVQEYHDNELKFTYEYTYTNEYTFQKKTNVADNSYINTYAYPAGSEYSEYDEYFTADGVKYADMRVADFYGYNIPVLTRMYDDGKLSEIETFDLTTFDTVYQAVAYATNGNISGVTQTTTDVDENETTVNFTDFVYDEGQNLVLFKKSDDGKFYTAAIPTDINNSENVLFADATKANATIGGVTYVGGEVYVEPEPVVVSSFTFDGENITSFTENETTYTVTYFDKDRKIILYQNPADNNKYYVASIPEGVTTSTTTSEASILENSSLANDTIGGVTYVGGEVYVEPEPVVVSSFTFDGENITSFTENEVTYTVTYFDKDRKIILYQNPADNNKYYVASIPDGVTTSATTSEVSIIETSSLANETINGVTYVAGEVYVEPVTPTHPDGIDPDTGRMWKDGKIANGDVDGVVYANGMSLFEANNFVIGDIDDQDRMTSFTNGGISYRVVYRPDDTTSVTALNPNADTTADTTIYDVTGNRVSRTVAYTDGETDVITYNADDKPSLVQEYHDGELKFTYEYTYTNEYTLQKATDMSDNSYSKAYVYPDGSEYSEYDEYFTADDVKTFDARFVDYYGLKVPVLQRGYNAGKLEEIQIIDLTTFDTIDQILEYDSNGLVSGITETIIDINDNETTRNYTDFYYDNTQHLVLFKRSDNDKYYTAAVPTDVNNSENILFSDATKADNVTIGGVTYVDGVPQSSSEYTPEQTALLNRIVGLTDLLEIDDISNATFSTSGKNVTFGANGNSWTYTINNDNSQSLRSVTDYGLQTYYGEFNASNALQDELITNTEYVAYMDYLNSLNYEELNDYIDMSLLLPIYNNSEVNPFTDFNLSNNIKSDIDNIIKVADENVKNDTTGTITFGGAVADAMVKNYKTTTKTDAEILAEVSVGDVLEKADGLYVSDGTALKKLNMSKEDYISLFPAIGRYSASQNQIGDCYFVAGTLLGCISNKTAFAEILQMFSVADNKDITITFKGLPDYPVTFQGGELFDMDRYETPQTYPNDPYAPDTVSGPKGIQMLEQAYSLAVFAYESERDITSLDIDDAIYYIDGGGFTSTAQNYILGNNIAELIPTVNFHALDETKVNSVQAQVLNYFNALNTYSEAIASYGLLDVFNQDSNLQIAVENLTYYYSVLGESNLWADCLEGGVASAGKILTLLAPYNQSEYMDIYDDIVICASYLADNQEQFQQIASALSQHDDFVEIFMNYDDATSELIPILQTEVYDEEKDEMVTVYNDEVDSTGNLATAIGYAYDLDTLIPNISKDGLYDALYADQLAMFNDNATLFKQGNIILNTATISSFNAEDEDNANRKFVLNGHGYMIQDVDIVNQTMHVINPWSGALTIEITYDDFMKYYDRLYIADVRNIA